MSGNSIKSSISGTFIFSLWFFTVPRAFGSWTDSFWTSRVHINYSKLRLYEQWQCFASFIYLFKHEISNGCEMAVNFWKLKHDKNFYIESNRKISSHTNLQTLCEQCGRPLICVLLLTLSHLGDWHHAPNRLIDRRWNLQCDSSIPKAKFVDQSQLISSRHANWYPLVDKLGTVNTCRERQ